MYRNNTLPAATCGATDKHTQPVIDRTKDASAQGHTYHCEALLNLRQKVWTGRRLQAVSPALWNLETASESESL